MEDKISELEKKLKIKFKNKNLLKNALIHRSFLNENPDFGLGSNERLEFLGDAVLELIVTEFLFKHQKEEEGVLTSFRASLVNTEILSNVANKLNLADYLYLSKGEKNDITSKSKKSILADACEAIIGAIYLDQGFAKAKKFISDNIIIYFDNILKNKSYIDYKTYFQEVAQEKIGITPTYKVIEESGPDHDKMFKMGLYISDELVAYGIGKNKQKAQEDAAKNGIEKKHW
ncbi:MAG TPA: ribonuclease III [bacterium]|nr:ribonuclease III [bacterium]HPO11196.1 ribonuclease III [bacterium]HQL11389.1 ribonuclease III [bacterium]